MRITFICGSLEPGRDGVGDYTRRLAGELIQQGHQASIIALNDMYLGFDFEGIQHSDNINLPILRLPSIWPSEKRFRNAKKYIRKFDPDFLSLQFVIFSFNSKGLPFRLNKRLRILGNGKPWHIMFHELWVGMDTGSSFKLMIWGNLQRWLIKSLADTLQPTTVHTQTKLYQLQLMEIGIDAKYLPLFSNIPMPHFCSGDIDDSISSKNTITLVLFGGIHPGAPVDKFAVEASSYAKENNIQMNLIIIGRSGIEKDRWASICKYAGLNVKLLGEQPAESVSKVLRSCTFGISTTPIDLAEKSGTVAAMLEHGLPVLCVRNSWKVNGIKEHSHPSGVVAYHTGCLRAFFENRVRVISNTTVSTIGLKFSEDLLKLNNTVKYN